MDKRYEKYKDLFEQIKNIFDKALIENHLTSKINYEKKNNYEFILQCNNVIIEFPEFQKLTYLIKAVCLNQFPQKCKNELCNKYLNYTATYINKNEYCSFSCAHKSKEVQEKFKQTMIKKYGVISPLSVTEFLEKAKQTSLEHYGVEYPSQSKEFKEKVKKTSLEKYGVEHVLQAKEIREKTKKTSLEKYGVDNPAKSKEIKEKIKKTNLERYGSTNPFKSKETKEKIEKTNLERYGSISPFGSKKVQEKAKQTMFKKYGVDNPTQSKEIQEKIKQTNLEKYGVENIFQSKEIQEKIKQTNLKRYGVENTFQLKETQEKIKQTNLEKYGVESSASAKEVREKIEKTNLERYGSISPFGSKEVRKKAKQTNLEKYGVENAIEAKQIQKKAKQTNLEKYGVNFPLQSKEIFEKTHEKRIKNQLEKIKNIGLKLGYELLSNNYSKITDEYTWKHVICGNEFKTVMHQTKTFKSSSYIPYCPYCFPHNKSKTETEVYDFIKSIFNGEKILQHNRQLIKPYELDIVIPDKKIAIEFNGTYWHSTQFGVNNSYHLMKTEMCEKEGYQLIHIFEHEWINKQEIVKEKLKAILGVEQEKVYARKCIVKEIDIKTKNDFLNEYHIQGEDKSKVKLGLFHSDELVAVMTFGYPRFNKNYNWELIRYATSKHVIGGAGKLLAFFRNHYTGSIITYADRRFSRGNMYEKLGFRLNGVSQPNYWWIKNNEILSRYQTQKHNLKDILKDKFDQNKSEFLNMSSNGYYQLFDCGNLIYILN